MATDLEYALLAGASYISSRKDENKFPIPFGWEIEAGSYESSHSGFEAVTFKKGSEYVVAYAGTYDKDVKGDLVADAGLAIGLGSVQLLQAANYYLEFKALHPFDEVTFTGHSLGGGLASLISVFFQIPAYTFNQAPFANSAEKSSTLENLYNFFAPDVAIALKNDLMEGLNSNAGILTYSEENLSTLTSFIQQREANGGIPNSEFVVSINVDGEFLSGDLLKYYDRIIGLRETISENGNGASGMDLHAQALLVAYLQSRKTAAQGWALNEVTFELPDLLKMIFDRKLFWHDTDTSEKDFINNLIRHEAGGVGYIPVGGDAMVTRFTSDLWKLAQQGGMTLNDGNTSNADLNELSNALIAFVMQKYYEETSAGDKQELLTDLSTAGIGSNGVRFDMTKVSGKLDFSWADHEKFNLEERDEKGNYYLKGYQSFLLYLAQGNNGLSAEDKQMIQSLLPYLRDWYVQAGASGMTATDTLNHGAFMLGGTSTDNLTGGTGADLLVGNAGDDVLTGGMGNDVLIGGKDNDTYKYNSGDGFDTILDRDGNGSIVEDSLTLTGGAQYGDARVYRAKDDKGVSHLYTYVNGDKTMGGDLIIDGAMLIKDYQSTAGNHMGFTFADAVADVNPATPDTPQTDREIPLGDQKNQEFTITLPADTVIDPAWKWSIIQPIVNNWGKDDNGNDIIVSRTYNYNQRDDLDNWLVSGSEPDRADSLNGSSVNDHISSGGGNDSIYATQGGGDYIEAGEGDNTVNAGTGNDYITAGTGDDKINAGDGDNFIAAGDGINTVNSGTGSDFIKTGNGRDTIRAGNGDNYVDAGAERDWIIAGTGIGNDILIGGADGDILSGGGGDDRLYANTQIDIVTAIELGNTADNLTTQGDWLAGGDGDDTLVGSDARDVIMGGDGTDLLIGGAGDDNIMGDTNWLATRFEWTVTDMPHLSYFYPVNSNVPSSVGAADVIYAGAGDDHVWGEQGNDVIFGEKDNDQLQGGSGNDIILGGGGQDLIFGEGLLSDTAGEDYLDGGAEEDIIFGGGGNDIIVGGTGNDYLYGESGEDTYIYNVGDGKDTIYDIKGENNTLRFGSGISSGDVKLRLGSLMLDLGNGDQIHIKNMYHRDRTVLEIQAGINPNGSDILTDFDRNDVFNSASIGSFEFADGTVMNTDELLARGFDLDGTAGDDIINGTNTVDRINGLAGDDTLNGGEGDDIINGGAGNDLLHGDGGNDVYLFDRGDGQDIVSDTQGANTIRFGAGVSPADVTFARSGYDLVLGINGTTDQITIQNWGLSTSARVANVEFVSDSTTVWDTAFLNAHMPYTIIGTAGDETLYAWVDQNAIMQGMAGNDTLLGNAGNDVLDGGEGSDLLNGGAGSNTYVFNLGGGNDTIEGSSYQDSIYFGAGITAADLVVSQGVGGIRLNYSPYISPDQSGDSVLIRGDSYPDQLKFADGTHMSINEFIVGQGGYAVTGSSGKETLVDTFSSAISFTGGEGNDLLVGGGGNTTYHFNQGDGSDSVVDLAGLDTFAFGEGITVDDISFAYEDWGDFSPKFKLYYGNDDISILNGERGVIEQFRFADGSTYSFAQLATMKGFSTSIPIVIPGFAIAENPVSGVTIQYYSDILEGTAGNDTIFADDETSSVIDGGKGDDHIQVRGNDGSGHNKLLFNVGDGHDTINVISGTDLIFGVGIEPNSLSFSYVTRTYQAYGGPFVGYYMRTVTDLTIHYGTQGDSIFVGNGLDYYTNIYFAGGGSTKYGQMIGVLPSGVNGGGQSGVPVTVPVIYNIVAGQQNEIDTTTVAGSAIFRFGEGISSKDVTFQQQGPDMLASFTVNGVASGSLLLQNYDLLSSNAPPLYNGPWLFTDGSTLTIACGNNFNGIGSYGINQYDASGRQIRAEWVNSDGTDGYTIFNPDGSKDSYNSDGSFIRILNDGKGVITASTYDMYGVLLSDTWRNTTDGSYGNDTYNLDGSGTGYAYYIDESYGTVTHDGHGNVTTRIYNADNILIGDTWIKANGSYGTDTINFNGTSSGTSHYLDGSYSTNTKDISGNIDTLTYDVNGVILSVQNYIPSSGTFTDYFNTSGVITSRSFNYIDGSYSTEIYNADGSRSGISYAVDGSSYSYIDNGLGLTTWQSSDGSYGTDFYISNAPSYGTGHNSDGSYYTYTDDGHGSFKQLDYDASGNLIGDSWALPNGLSGNDLFNLNGTSSGTSYDIDGSYSTYTNDGHGSIVTTQYDAVGIVLGSNIAINDGLGNTRTTLFDANGTKLSDSWAKSDGSTGTETFNANGTSAGFSHYLDGSYSTNTGDIYGNVYTLTYDITGVKLSEQTFVPSAGSFTDYFNAAGVLISSISNYADGSYSIDTYNSDGTSSGTYYQVDGSYYVYSNDGKNTIVGAGYDVNGIKLNNDWSYPDGTYGANTFNTDGTSSGTTYNSDGSYSTYTNDGLANRTTNYFAVNGDPLGLSLATLTSTTVYDASGAVLGVAIGSMVQLVQPAGASEIQFASGIANTDIAVSQDSQGNFLISYNNGAGTLDIPADSAIGAPVVASFNDGSSWQFVKANGNAYSYAAGSGVVYLTNAAGNGTVEFGAGITTSMITLGLGSLMLQIGNTGDVLHIEGFNPADALNSGEIQTFKFIDGTTLTYAQLLATGFNISGTATDDILNGTSVSDNISTGAGNDILTGGDGNDTLMGGAGNDRYVFNLGDGSDTILDMLGNDTLYLGGNLTAANLQGTRVGDNLIVKILGTSDTITLTNWFVQTEGVNRIEFSDSSTLDHTGIEGLLNQAPVANADAITATEDVGVLSVAAATLLTNDTDPDIINGDILNIVSVSQAASGAVVSLQNGNVQYDIGNLYQYLAQDQTATDTFSYTVSDTAGVRSTATVTLAITGVNDAAVTINDAASVQEDGVISASGNVLSNDTDTDRGTVLTVANAGTLLGTYGNLLLNADGNYSYALNNGSLAVQSLAAGKAVSESFTYLATDGLLETPATLTINITGTNDALIVAIPLAAQSITQGQMFTYALAANSFTDIDRTDKLSYVATLADDTALPSWLTFNAATQTFSGTPGLGDSTSLSIKVTATDTGGLAASSNFTLAVTAPVLTGTAGNDVLTGTIFDDTLSGLAGVDTLNGGAGNDTLDGGAGADKMFGGLGNDTYLVDIASDVVTENVNEGIDTVLSTVTYTLSANVENLTLTGTASISGTGNTLDNTLLGNAGNNVLNGGAGADTMTGGLGNDTYVVDNIGDIVTENLAEGTDTVQSSISYILGDNLENLTLTGTAAINGTGNALNNVLTGNTAANILTGGLGNDTYVVDNIGDVVMENLSEGTDIVKSSVTYTLSDNVENLTLTGTATINATGNALNNVLTGNTAANILTGGLGNDTYVVDNIGDVVIENLNEGTDTVQSSITYTLGDNVENLTLTGTAAINATGNALNNVLTGNTAANTLTGGLGNDTYVVDNTGDVVVENLNEGTDTVKSSITYTLGDNLENLTLTGTAAINGTGNGLNNVLTGNVASNILTGGIGNDTLNGAAGADTLIGGLGNDIYVVDDINDVVTENLDEGVDLVQSSVSYTLADNVENITLTGTTAINATGNALNNVLTGNAAANELAGGAGDDTYVAGLGDTVIEASNAGIDTVQSALSYALGANVENLTLTSTAAINGTGNELDNVLLGNSGINTLTGGAGNDTLNGAAGADILIGGMGDDTYVVDNVGDVVTENLDEGADTVLTSVTYTLAANVENITLTGASVISGTGNALDNVLRGNAANNTLAGGDGNDMLIGGLGNDILKGDAGNDVMEGADGNDTLSDTAGNNLFNGGAGVDKLTGSTGNELFIGGIGNDTITTGTGADIIAFNKGDGQDILVASTGTDNTISLGGGIQYANLAMSKSGNNLIFSAGNGDQITLQNWYASTSNHSVANLQFVLDNATFNAASADTLLNHQVQTFNFAALATSFDQALAANPTLTSWSMTDALLTAHLAGSDTSALGGDMAYQYGLNNSLAGIGLASAQTMMNDANFGATAQTLKPLNELQVGVVKLG